jgi:hypothetical protein
MREIIVTLSITGLIILLPICHYWVFIKGPKEKDE